MMFEAASPFLELQEIHFKGDIGAGRWSNAGGAK